MGDLWVYPTWVNSGIDHTYEDDDVTFSSSVSPDVVGWVYPIHGNIEGDYYPLLTAIEDAINAEIDSEGGTNEISFVSATPSGGGLENSGLKIEGDKDFSLTFTGDEAPFVYDILGFDEGTLNRDDVGPNSTQSWLSPTPMDDGRMWEHRLAFVSGQGTGQAYANRWNGYEYRSILYQVIEGTHVRSEPLVFGEGGTPADPNNHFIDLLTKGGESGQDIILIEGFSGDLNIEEVNHDIIRFAGPQTFSSARDVIEEIPTASGEKYNLDFQVMVVPNED